MLQIDGNALSRRQVVRFDSNTPHDDSHSLVHLSLRSLASADRQGCSSSSTRAPQIWLKADRAREALFTPSRGRKMSCLRGSNLVFHLTTCIESDLISRSDHPDSHFSTPPPRGSGRTIYRWLTGPLSVYLPRSGSLSIWIDPEQKRSGSPGSLQGRTI